MSAPDRINDHGPVQCGNGCDHRASATGRASALAPYCTLRDILVEGQPYGRSRCCTVGPPAHSPIRPYREPAGANRLIWQSEIFACPLLDSQGAALRRKHPLPERPMRFKVSPASLSLCRASSPSSAPRHVGIGPNFACCKLARANLGRDRTEVQVVWIDALDTDVRCVSTLVAGALTSKR